MWYICVWTIRKLLSLNAIHPYSRFLPCQNQAESLKNVKLSRICNYLWHETFHQFLTSALYEFQNIKALTAHSSLNYFSLCIQMRRLINLSELTWGCALCAPLFNVQYRSQQSNMQTSHCSSHGCNAKNHMFAETT